MSNLSLYPPAHRAIWGQCIGDALSNYLRGKDAQNVWSHACATSSLPYKRGQISAYSKQMLTIAKLFQKHRTKAPKDFIRLVKEQLIKQHDHSLLCKALSEAQPFNLPDIEMAVRIGPLSALFSDCREMLDCIYPLTKLMSTHPHAIVGTLIFAAFCWNEAQPTPLSDEDLFHFMRNWSVKTELPSETWWMFEQANRILAQGYPLQEMLDFVNNITNRTPISLPSTRESLSVIPVVLQRTENGFDWTQLLTLGNTQDVLMGMKGCLMGIRSEIPTWQALPVQHLKPLNQYPIQHLEPESIQLKLF